MKKIKGSGLRYTPINDFSLLPRPLVEQIKPKLPDVDRFYNVLRALSSGQSFWAVNYLGVFADHEHVIKGFMWLTLNPITYVLHINMLSVDNAYQNKGILGEAKNLAQKLMKEVHAEKLTISTRAPRVFAKYGLKPSSVVAMELEGE